MLTGDDREALCRAINDYDDNHLIKDGLIWYKDQFRLQDVAAIDRLEMYIKRAADLNYRSTMELGRIKAAIRR